MKNRTPILILAAAQFVMVLDTTVMNVAISNVVHDLNTTVSQVQAAITLYALVMAALMMTGGKLGDILGRRRTFSIGIVVYAAGSLTTAIAPNIGVLYFGWSGLEGIGAAMVIPAIAALTAGNYEGRERALAYGVIGGVAAAGAAAGPLIGGFVTEAASWRWVFAGEVVILAGVLLVVRRIKDIEPETRPKLDLVGSALTAIGLALVVLAILKIPEWGFIRPKGALTIGGTEITPFGFSAVPFMIVLGAAVLVLFTRWERRRERVGRQTLLSLDLLKNIRLRAGLSMLMMQMLVLNGTFFVLPLYLQVVLGKNALETGVAILPISIAMLICALSGPGLARKIAPRLIVRIGLASMTLSALLLLASVDYEVNRALFLIGLGFFGAGIGLLASQLGNVIMSSVDAKDVSEAGGLQGTAQNLGASLGTALIGAVLLAGLGSSLNDAVTGNPAIANQTEAKIHTATQAGVEFVPKADVQKKVESAGATPAEAQAIATAYGDSQLFALKEALGAAAVFALFGFLFTRRLPPEPLT